MRDFLESSAPLLHSVVGCLLEAAKARGARGWTDPSRVPGVCSRVCARAARLRERLVGRAATAGCAHCRPPIIRAGQLPETLQAARPPSPAPVHLVGRGALGGLGRESLLELLEWPEDAAPPVPRTAAALAGAVERLCRSGLPNPTTPCRPVAANS